MKIKSIILIFLLSCLCIASARAQINYMNFIFMAKHELSEQRYTEAIQRLNIAISAKPDNFDGYFLRGVAKYSLGDYRGAIDDFTKTLDIHPLYVRALQYRGISHAQLANYNDALADYRAAIKLDPFDADIYFSSGATFLHLKKYEDAIKDYDMALIIQPDLSLAYVNRGMAKSLLKQYDDALKDLDKAVFYDTYNPEVYFRRGIIRMECKDFDTAISDFNTAIHLDEKNPIFYFNRGIALLNIHDTTNAIKDLEYVNKLDERNALTYYNRGLIHLQQKDYNKSLQMFDNVVLINPDNIYGYMSRSAVFYETQRWDEAEDDLTKVIELFPDYVSAWINRSAVRNQKGNHQGAWLDQMKAREIISLLNGNDSDTDSLYALYADSLYLKKIITFESDFVNGETRKKQVQFADIQIEPFANFIVTAILPQQYKMIGNNKDYYVDATLSLINENNDLPMKLVIGEEYMISGRDDFIINDSIIATIKDPDLRNLLQGMHHFEIYNYQKAEEAFSSLINRDGYDSYGRMNLSAILMAKAELIAEQQQNNNIFITTQKIPDTKATDKKNTPDYSSAMNVITVKLLHDKNNPFLWFNLGNSFLHMKDYNRAIDAYSEAISHEPLFAQAYYNRALTLIFINEIQLAVSDLSKAGELGLSEAYVVMKRFTNP